MKWLSPTEYAELVGKTRGWVYLQVQLGRLKSRKVRSKEMIMQVAGDKIDPTEKVAKISQD